MKPLNEIEEYLDTNAQLAMDQFNKEISTDENRDYRRGFRAGVLFAYLHTKSNIGNLDDATNKQPAS